MTDAVEFLKGTQNIGVNFLKNLADFQMINVTLNIWIL